MAGNNEAIRREVTATFLQILGNNCVLPRFIKRDYQKYFEGKVKIGSSLDIKRPLRTIGADGQAFQPEGLVRVTVPMTISYWNQESFVYNDTEQAMFLNDDMKENYIKPKAINLANKVDRYMMQYIQATTPNFVGTPGTTPTTLQTYNSARTKLNQLLAPDSDRVVVWNSSFEQNIIGAGSTLFNPNDVIGKQYLSGKVGRYAGFDFMRDEQTPSFTVGTYAGAGVVNGANQTGTQVVTNGWTAASLSLNVGDRVTFAGCFEINGQSRLVLPNVLKQFVITAPVVDAAGAATLSIFPAIIPSGPYQNCSASPTNGGAVTVAGASGAQAQTAFALQQGAYTWAAIRLQDVSEYGANCTVMTDEDTGISIRCTQQWDNRLAEVTYRMDFVYGIAQTYSDYESCVIYG